MSNKYLIKYTNKYMCYIQTSMDLFRKEIYYALIKHTHNDLNPDRPEISALRGDVETTSE